MPPVNHSARIIASTLLLLALAAAAATRMNSFGLEKRIPFTTSRLIGSPDPPLPYRSQRTFPKLNLRHPLFITHQPQTERMLVVEQSERILAFTNRADAAETNIFCFIRDHEIYSVHFHPGYATPRWHQSSPRTTRSDPLICGSSRKRG